MGNCLETVKTEIRPVTSDPLPGPVVNPKDVPSQQSMLSVSNESWGSIPTPRSEGQILSSPNLKIFNYNELKSATKNFRPDSLIGEGGFGCVFKGWIDEGGLATKPGMGLVVAVKKLSQDSPQGHKEWLAEVNILGQLHHPNLVKLIGYCSEDDHRLLVYEYMQKGSLENHLFRRGSQPLSWAIRVKVALGAAKGLCFLHNSPVIYRDFKASNILLDSNFNVKLSDFGLAKDGPTGDKTHVSTRVMGTYGYAAPEYVATGNDGRHCLVLFGTVMEFLRLTSSLIYQSGRLTAKSDVYSFGVVLLEILSGRRAVEKNKPVIEQNLVEWSKPYLKDKGRLFRVMDTRLEGQYNRKGAQKAAALALQCLHSEAKNRPHMKDVVETLQQLQDLRDRDRDSVKQSSPSPNFVKSNVSPLHPSYQKSPKVH